MDAEIPLNSALKLSYFIYQKLFAFLYKPFDLLLIRTPLQST